MAEKLGIRLDSRTKGPLCDNHFMTETAGVFSCGNALHVNDLVDYVSESGELAGTAAAKYAFEASCGGNGTVPEGTADSGAGSRTETTGGEKVVFYFRSRESIAVGNFVFTVNGKEVFTKRYRNLKPPEMERLELELSLFGAAPGSRIEAAVRKEAGA